MIPRCCFHGCLPHPAHHHEERHQGAGVEEQFPPGPKPFRVRGVAEQEVQQIGEDALEVMHRAKIVRQRPGGRLWPRAMSLGPRASLRQRSFSQHLCPSVFICGSRLGSGACFNFNGPRASGREPRASLFWDHGVGLGPMIGYLRYCRCPAADQGACPQGTVQACSVAGHLPLVGYYLRRVDARLLIKARARKGP